MITSEKNKSHISTLYFRNGHVLWLTIIILLVGGFASINNLPRLEDPRITQRGATILTFLPGASAERIEALVNEPIEDALEEIADIKTIESTARSNVSSILVELQDNVTTQTNEDAFSKIRSRLQNIQGELPDGATIPFLDDERGAMAYTLIIGIGWDGQGEVPLSLLHRLSLGLKDRMLNTPNTELVRIFGGVEEEISVIPDQNELAALGLNPQQISEIIRFADSKVSAGQFRSDQQDIRIEVDGALDTVNRISAIPITRSENGLILTLGDIAQVKRDIKSPPDQMGLIDGKRVMYVAVRADENVRLDKWNERALSELSQFRAEYDERISIDLIFDQNEYTQDRLGGLLTNLIAGAIIVVVIVFLTMGLKSGLVVGSSLPLSAAGAIFALNFFDEGIHQMSIFGMIIAIGLLIDSSIVMTDEVRKQIRKGYSRIEAMEKAVRHLTIPLLASTFTTVLGFMPIFLLPGNAGDFVSPIAISVVMALCVSFLLAITVIPTLATRFSSDRTERKTTSWWRDGLPSPGFTNDIKAFVLHAAHRPKRYILIAIAPAFVGFGMMSTMDVEFFPAGDRDMFEIQLWTSSENSIAKTNQVIQRAEAVLENLEGVEKSYWLAGASIPPVYYNQIPTQDNNNAYAQAVVVADTPQRAVELISRAQIALNEALPEARVVVKAFAQGPPVDAPIEFRILGPELNTLRQLGEEVRAIMHQQPKLTHSRASVEGGEAKLWLNVDEFQAENVGLSLRDVARQYEANLEGFSGGSVLEGIEELPVRVRLSDENRSTIETISNLQLTAPNVEGWVPADTISNLELRPEIGSITRYNGQRVNTLYGYLTPDATAVSVASDIMQQINDEITVPNEYKISVAGDSEQQADAVGNLLTYAPILVVLMVATLILAFRSVAMAGIIWLVAILSVGLGMLGLKIAGYPLGFNPLIGSIGLMGVAINDTIVVLAAIISNDKAKKGDVQEIINETFGCARHVLSTTFTTIGGFIPLLLFSGGTFWPPLSVVIAGGIGFALILAMFFTPLAYKIFADLHYKKRNETVPEGVLA